MCSKDNFFQTFEIEGKEFQKYIDCEGDYSGSGYAIILNGKRAY